MTKPPTHTTAQLVMKYVASRRAEGLESSTLEQMHYRLGDFAKHAPADPRRINRGHVERWNDRPDLAPSYRRGRLSSLRGFSLWLAARNGSTRDFTLGVRLPRVVEGVPKRLIPEEVARLVEWAKGDRRLLLIVLLMLQEGLRRIEVSRLNIEDVDFTEKAILVRGKGGQGRHTDALPLSAETWRTLNAYLIEEGHRSGPLVRNRVRKHGRLAPGTITGLVSEAMIECGIKAKSGDVSKTPHSLRHTMGHDVLRSTGNVRSVQRAMRHRSVRSTEGYLRGYVDDDLRQIMDGRVYDALSELHAAGVLSDEMLAEAAARAANGHGEAHG